MNDLKYHKRALELIGQQPVFSGMTFPTLPASVAEWYSLTNTVEWLQKFSNQDVPLHPSEFHSSRYEDKELIVFMHENQGVLWWAFEKSDADDPEVYINLDPPPDNWVNTHEAFSTFVYNWLFDHIHWFEDGLFMIKGGVPLNNHILEILHTNFVQEPSSIGLDNHRQYRFSNRDQKIMIVTNDYQSTWQFAADSEESLNDVYERFKHLFRQVS
jgi:hypothetical protein